jgi:hypothetical protein
VVIVTLFVVIALTVFVMLCVLGFALARRCLRLLRRGVAESRRRVAEVRTRFLPPGPRRDAALLRRTLDAELRATRDMLESAPQGLVFRADAAAMLHELAVTATALDGELAGIERFLDPAQQRAALTGITPQVEQLIDTTYTARHTILRTAAEDRDRQLAALRATVAQQASALDTYRRDGRELSI